MSARTCCTPHRSASVLKQVIKHRLCLPINLDFNAAFQLITIQNNGYTSFLIKLMEMWRNQFQKFQHVVDTQNSARSDLAREVIFTPGDNHAKEQMVRT